MCLRELTRCLWKWACPGCRILGKHSGQSKDFASLLLPHIFERGLAHIWGRFIFLMVLGNAFGYSASAQLLISSQPWLKEQKLWIGETCHLCLVQNNAAAEKYNGCLLFSTSP